MRFRARAKILPLARESSILLLFVVVSVFMTSPLLAKARTHVVDLGVDDTLLYARYARCFVDWALGRSPGWLSFDMYFPSLLSGATNDASPGIGIQVMPLALFFRDYLFTVNLVTFASFVMCAHATYLLVREMCGSRGAGIVAGLAFSFCLYRMRQLDHPNVLQMQWLPYALYFMTKLAKAPTIRRGLVFAAVFFFAMTASFNVAIYSSFVFPVFALWLFLGARGRRLRFARFLSGAVLLDVVPLYFAYRPYLILRDVGSPVREAREIDQFSSHVQSFHAAPAFSRMYGHLASNMSDESGTFLGWSVLILAAVGVFGLLPRGDRRLVSPKREWLLLPFGVARAVALSAALLLLAGYALIDPWARWAFFAGLFGYAGLVLVKAVFHPSRKSPSPVVFVVAIALCYSAASLGLKIDDHGKKLADGVWAYVQQLPGFEQVRTPARLFLVTSFAASILAGLGARAIAFAFPNRIVRFVVFALLSGGVLYDLRCSPIPLRAMPTEKTAPTIYKVLASLPKPGAVLELPLEWSTRERRPVYYANVHRRPTVSGVSSWGLYYFNALEPGGWVTPSEGDGGTVALEALEAAHVAGLRYVVLKRSWSNERDLALYAAGLRLRGGHPIGTYGDDELWELPDPPPSRPPRPADVLTRFGPFKWRERSKHEVFLEVDFVNKTGDELYARKIQRFDLRATSAGDTIGEGHCYLTPPLIPTHGDWLAYCRMTLVPKARPDWVKVELSDDDGVSWGSSRLRLAPE